MATDILDTLQFRIFGSDIAPENVPLHELADLLKGFEQAILVTAEQQGSSGDTPVIGLTGVDKGSLRLSFAAAGFFAITAFSEIVQAIETDTYNALPQRALEGVQKLVAFSQKRQCDFEFYRPSVQLAPVARISHVHPPDLFATRTFVGTTDLYGEITQVGGAEPKVRLRLPNGKLFSCECSKDFARNIADRLYSVVGLHGIAYWDTQMLTMKRFIAQELLPYAEVSIADAFSELRQVVDGYEPVDVEQLLQELRGV